MPLTPIDVRNVAFNRPPIGKRGYDEEEVDAFLDELERELARLLDENVALRSRLGSAGSEDHDLEQQLRALKAEIEGAQQEKAEAERTVAETRAELDRAREQSLTVGLAPGDSPGARVLAMARRTAEKHVSDARREADEVIDAGRGRADQILQQALATAEKIVREARDRHQRAVDGLDAKRSELLAQINGLAELAADYRKLLREALTTHLTRLELAPPAGGEAGPAGS